jgi:hypothetical protein
MYKLFFVPGIQKTGSGAGSAALFQKIKWDHMNPNGSWSIGSAYDGSHLMIA